MATLIKLFVATYKYQLEDRASQSKDGGKMTVVKDGVLGEAVPTTIHGHHPYVAKPWL